MSEDTELGGGCSTHGPQHMCGHTDATCPDQKKDEPAEALVSTGEEECQPQESIESFIPEFSLLPPGKRELLVDNFQEAIKSYESDKSILEKSIAASEQAIKDLDGVSGDIHHLDVPSVGVALELAHRVKINTAPNANDGSTLLFNIGGTDIRRRDVERMTPPLSEEEKANRLRAEDSIEENLPKLRSFFEEKLEEKKGLFRRQQEVHEELLMKVRKRPGYRS